MPNEIAVLVIVFAAAFGAIGRARTVGRTINSLVKTLFGLLTERCMTELLTVGLGAEFIVTELLGALR